jgi:hypothetical protein
MSDKVKTMKMKRSSTNKDDVPLTMADLGQLMESSPQIKDEVTRLSLSGANIVEIEIAVT